MTLLINLVKDKPASATLWSKAPRSGFAAFAAEEHFAIVS